VSIHSVPRTEDWRQSAASGTARSRNRAAPPAILSPLPPGLLPGRRASFAPIRSLDEGSPGSLTAAAPASTLASTASRAAPSAACFPSPRSQPADARPGHPARCLPQAHAARPESLLNLH